MILDESQLSAVLQGRKTQVRRPIRRGEFWVSRIGSAIPLAATLHAPAAVRALIVDVRRQRLANMTADDARAEGFDSLEDFACWWTEQHDADWIARREGVVVDEVRDDELLERFNDRHAQLQVRVIHLRPYQEPEFLMPATNRPIDAEDYTTGADLLRAGEVVHDDYQVAGWSRAARAAEGDRYDRLLSERQRLPLLERMRLAQAAAASRGIEIDRDLHVIAQRVATIEKRVYRPLDRLAS